MAEDTTIEVATILKDLNGNPLKVDDQELSVGRACAIILSSGKSYDPLRSYILATKLAEAKEPIIVNASEFGFIKEAIQSNENFTPIIKGQLLSLLVWIRQITKNSTPIFSGIKILTLGGQAFKLLNQADQSQILVVLFLPRIILTPAGGRIMV